MRIHAVVALIIIIVLVVVVIVISVAVINFVINIAGIRAIWDIDAGDV